MTYFETFSAHRYIAIWLHTSPICLGIELIAWGKLNLCKQVDKVLNLIYLDADWSAAQPCLNRLLTPVPTPLILALEVHLAYEASCETHTLTQVKNEDLNQVGSGSYSHQKFFLSEVSTLFFANIHKACMFNIRIHSMMQ